MKLVDLVRTDYFMINPEMVKLEEAGDGFNAILMEELSATDEVEVIYKAGFMDRNSRFGKMYGTDMTYTDFQALVSSENNAIEYFMPPAADVIRNNISIGMLFISTEEAFKLIGKFEYME